MHELNTGSRNVGEVPVVRPLYARGVEKALFFHLFNWAVKSVSLLARPNVSPIDVKGSCPPRLIVAKCRDDPRDGVPGARWNGDPKRRIVRTGVRGSAGPELESVAVTSETPAMPSRECGGVKRLSRGFGVLTSPRLKPRLRTRRWRPSVGLPNRLSSRLCCMLLPPGLSSSSNG